MILTKKLIRSCKYFTHLKSLLREYYFLKKKHVIIFRGAREKRKEMKLLLDMYKGVSKETRDKAEVYYHSLRIISLVYMSLQ